MTILTQQLFRAVKQMILDTKQAKLKAVSEALFGPEAKSAMDLESRLQSVFKD